MKNIVIAGGSGGIGLELTQRLLPKYNIHVLARNRRALPVIDGELDALVYAPGSINLKPFRSFKMQDYQSDMEINFFGAVRFVQHYLPQLNKQRAAIVFFSTVAVDSGMAFHTSVAAAKGALEAFSRSLAAELAPAVRVNCIAPSLTKTPLAEKLVANEARLKAAEDRHPLKRIGQPSEIASCAEWLISDDANFITAQTITIDGGISNIK
jgi:NAD(P)-dependent dehydrogenase (short-subunit alcohol dehydrogenase family)